MASVKFGRGPVEKVWFGWEEETRPGQTPGMLLEVLRVQADLAENEERARFRKKYPRAYRGGDE